MQASCRHKPWYEGQKGNENLNSHEHWISPNMDHAIETYHSHVYSRPTLLPINKSHQGSDQLRNDDWPGSVWDSLAHQVLELGSWFATSRNKIIKKLKKANNSSTSASGEMLGTITYETCQYQLLASHLPVMKWLTARELLVSLEQHRSERSQSSHDPIASSFIRWWLQSPGAWLQPGLQGRDHRGTERKGSPHP